MRFKRLLLLVVLLNIYNCVYSQNFINDLRKVQITNNTITSIDIQLETLIYSANDTNLLESKNISSVKMYNKDYHFKSDEFEIFSSKDFVFSVFHDSKQIIYSSDNVAQNPILLGMQNIDSIFGNYADKVKYLGNMGNVKKYVLMRKDSQYSQINYYIDSSKWVIAQFDIYIGSPQQIGYSKISGKFTKYDINISLDKKHFNYSKYLNVSDTKKPEVVINNYSLYIK